MSNQEQKGSDMNDSEEKATKLFKELENVVEQNPVYQLDTKILFYKVLTMTFYLISFGIATYEVVIVGKWSPWAQNVAAFFMLIGFMSAMYAGKLMRQMNKLLSERTSKKKDGK